VAHSQIDRIGERIQNRGKLLVEWREGSQDCQPQFWRGRFDDQPLTLLAPDGVFAGELEFAGNSHRLVSAVLERLYVSFGRHGRSPWAHVEAYAKWFSSSLVQAAAVWSGTGIPPNPIGQPAAARSGNDVSRPV